MQCKRPSIVAVHYWPPELTAITPDVDCDYPTSIVQDCLPKKEFATAMKMYSTRREVGRSRQSTYELTLFKQKTVHALSSKSLFLLVVNCVNKTKLREVMVVKGRMEESLVGSAAKMCKFSRSEWLSAYTYVIIL